MKAIIVKYATTSGVLILEGKNSAEYPSMFTPEGWLSAVHGNDWHISRASAEEAVNKLFFKKERSLRKQLESLEEKKAEALKVVASWNGQP